MNGQCVNPRDADDPRTTDTVDQGEVSQRFLPYPRTHAERATEVLEMDDDGLESGKVESFRGFLEAGGTSRWEDQVKGEREMSASGFRPRAIARCERGGLLKGAHRRWLGKLWLTARCGFHASACIRTRLLSVRRTSRRRNV